MAQFYLSFSETALARFFHRQWLSSRDPSFDHYLLSTKFWAPMTAKKSSFCVINLRLNRQTSLYHESKRRFCLSLCFKLAFICTMFNAIALKKSFVRTNFFIFYCRVIKLDLDITTFWFLPQSLYFKPYYFRG